MIPERAPRLPAFRIVVMLVVAREPDPHDRGYYANTRSTAARCKLTAESCDQGRRRDVAAASSARDSDAELRRVPQLTPPRHDDLDGAGGKFSAP